MYHTIDQKITVAGVYHNGTFIPKKFKWNEKAFAINEITLSSDFKDGGVRKRYYSVVSGREVYRIEFDRDQEQWFLRELWVE